MHPYHRCRSCQHTKPREQFHTDRSRKDDLANLCKECVAEKNREYRAAHREQCIAATKAWHAARPTYLREWKQRRKVAITHTNTNKETTHGP